MMVVTDTSVPSVRRTPPAAAALPLAKPLFHSDPGAAWPSMASVVATAGDSGLCLPPPSAPPVLSAAQPTTLDSGSDDNDACSLVELDVSGRRDVDDIPSSGAQDPSSTEVDGDAATLVPSPRSSTSGDSFVILSELTPPTPGSPVALPTADATTVDNIRPERAGTVLDRLLNPPSLRLARLLETCADSGVDDVDRIVDYLTSRHTVPYTTEVLRQLVNTIIATRQDTAERLLQQLAQLQSSDASVTDTLLVITVSLQRLYSGETRL